MANAQLPSRIRVRITLGSKPMWYSTEDYCHSVADACQRNGHKDITSDDVKRGLWKLLNNYETNDFVSKFLKSHVVWEETLNVANS